MIKNKCEENGHELLCIDENWFGEDSVMATLECQKCKSKFRGVMIKDE